MSIIVIGAGQAGLATSYFLKRRNIKHVVLDAAGEVAHAWRARRPEMKLRTAAALSSLPGLQLSVQDSQFATAAAVAEYLELYAHTFGLPVALNRRVRSLRRTEHGFDVTIANTLTGALEQRHTPVVVWAGGAHGLPVTPWFAARLSGDIKQLTALSYRGPVDLPPGRVVVVGAGTSGIEIALDIAAHRRREVYLSGATSGSIDSGSKRRRLPQITVALTDTWPGLLSGRGSGGPERLQLDLAASAVVQVGRVTGAGPEGVLIDDGTSINCSTVIWCTGYVADHSWLHLPTNPLDHVSRHGESLTAHGFYAVGLPRRTTTASHLLGGVGRDAGRTVDHLIGHALFRTGGPVPSYDFPLARQPSTTTRKDA